MAIGVAIALANISIVAAALWLRAAAWDAARAHSLTLVGNQGRVLTGNPAYLAAATRVCASVEVPLPDIMLRVISRPAIKGAIKGQTSFVRKYWWTKRHYLITVYYPDDLQNVFLHELVHHVMAHYFHGNMNFAHDAGLELDGVERRARARL